MCTHRDYRQRAQDVHRYGLGTEVVGKTWVPNASQEGIDWQLLFVGKLKISGTSLGISPALQDLLHAQK